MLLIFIGILAGSIQCLAQQTDQKILLRVETNDGNEYLGEIISRDSVKLRLKTEVLGEIDIPILKIIKETFVESGRIINGQLWFENPQSTRYFWAPNGYGLKKDEAYFQNIWVLFNQIGYGFSDNFSIGIGTIPLFLFAGAPTPVWITPKFSVPVVENQFNLGIGAMIGTVLVEKNTSFGILYGISTFGSKDNNFSLGIGYGFAGGEMAKTPVINLSGMARTGSRGYFLMETHIVTADGETAAIATIGGRRIIKKSGLDFGFSIPIGMGAESFVAMPWLGITIPFGNYSK